MPYSHSLLLFYWDRLCDLGGVLLLAAASSLWLSSAHRSLLPAAAAVVALLWVLRPGGAVFARVPWGGCAARCRPIEPIG